MEKLKMVLIDGWDYPSLNGKTQIKMALHAGGNRELEFTIDREDALDLAMDILVKLRETRRLT